MCMRRDTKGKKGFYFDLPTTEGETKGVVCVLLQASKKEGKISLDKLGRGS